MDNYYSIAAALVLNLADLITGLAGAVRTHTIKSGALRDGLFKKFGFICCYFLALGIDKYGYLVGVDLNVRLLAIVIFYVAMTEVVSIIENISEINPDLLPEKLMELFHVKHFKDSQEEKKSE